MITDTRRVATKPTKRQLAAQDRLIEQAYYRHAAGRQISIMKISPLYADCRAALNAGGDLDAAMIAAVARYCEVAQ